MPATAAPAHTPGPWQLDRRAPGAKESAIFPASEAESELCEPIAIIPHDDVTEGGLREAEANARLIAAAPDHDAGARALLDCLTENDAGMFFVKGGRNADYNAAIRALRAAIARAEGRQP